VLPVPVDPTLTVIVPELDVRDRSLVTVQIVNLDPSQTFDGTVWTRQNPTLDWAPSSIGDLSAIPPTSSAPFNSRSVDLDVTGAGWLRVTGVMSGLGGNVSTCVRVGGRADK